jgi:anti-sigma factor RsiW
MMFRGDQHVDDWPEFAVDYLDGQLDQETRMAVERHLSTCPDCTARLHRQQSVVKLLQETPLYDPPEDLEYRAIGELVFPSPGGQPVGRPAELDKPYRTPKWQRTLRTWLPASVAVVALLAAVVGYGIARSGSGAEVANNSDRAAAPVTAAGAADSTATEESTLAGPMATSTTAGATTSTALTSQPPATAAPAAIAPTQDRKTMIREIENAQAPAFVSFLAALPSPGDDGQSSTTSTGEVTDTTAVDGTVTTAGAGTDTTTLPVTPPTVSAEQTANVVYQLAGFTGLRPLDRSLWMGGPTFAAYLPREDAEEFVDLVRSIGVSLGLVVALSGAPPARASELYDSLMEHKGEFPVLAAHRALQPATWGYDFTTSTLASPSGKQPTETTEALPDEAGTHVVIVICIQE